MACDLASALGLELYDWQRWAVRWILALDENGQPAVNTAIINVPRQNGKGAILEALELYWLLVANVPIVIHTAHEADTSAGHMDRIEGLTIDPDIELPNIKTYRSNGKERTRNLDGKPKPLLQYRTRTKATKRGASPQRVVLDEAQELQNAHIAALVPAMAAQSMDVDKLPQMIYTGSAPLEHSDYWRDLIDRVIKDRPERTFLAMWAADADADVSDVDVWYQTNPLLGLRISEGWVRDAEFLVMDPVDFATERLGVAKRPLHEHQAVIDVAVWDQLDDAGDYDKQTARLALDVAPDRSWSTLAVAGTRPDGRAQLRLVAGQPGTEWVVGELPDLLAQLGTDSVTIHKGSPAEMLVHDLERAGVEVDVMSTGDLAIATQRLLDAAGSMSPPIRHCGEPQLRRSLQLARTKPYGDGGAVFSRRTTKGDISPLLAATMAYGRLGAKEATPVEPWVMLK